MRTAARALLALCILAACLPLETGPASAGKPKGKAVSLRVLQRKLGECEPGGTCPDEVLHLGGITRIVGYVTDDDTGDVILVGETDESAPPLHLQDFIVALKSARGDYAELRGGIYFYSNPGCSIDPNPDVMMDLTEVSESIDSATTEEEVALGILDWYSACREPQEVKVFGVPFDTRFAKVMVDADYEMKRLVDGSDSLDIRGFRSLTDMSLAQARRDMLADDDSDPLSSLNRFWFYPGEVTYREDEGVKVIEQCPVVLLTEEEYLSSSGESVGSGRADALAAEFAGDFTDHYDEIADERPIYRELEGLFSMVALSKLMKADGVLTEAQFDLSYLLDRYRVPETPVPRTLTGHANVKAVAVHIEGYMPSKTWLPSCGGVGMDIQATDENILPDVTGRLERLGNAVLLSRPGASVLSWQFTSA
ncbi:MAG: DUF1598 domain-containing protein [Candidatus Eisenbacteria bacterium]